MAVLAKEFRWATRRIVQSLRQQSGVSPPSQFGASKGIAVTSCSGLSLAVEPVEAEEVARRASR
jgi:hypothetical protein